MRTPIRQLGCAIAAALGIWMGLGLTATKPAYAENTLIWAIPAAMSLFDPPQSCGWLTMNATNSMFNGLVDLERSKPDAPWASLKPSLAESWTISDDGKVYTFNLRKGVKFHDGTPFNAEVAKWNYDRIQNAKAPQYSKVGAAYLDYYTRWIDKTEVVDENTFRITLKEPNYEWLQSGQSSCGQPLLISPAAHEKYGEKDIALHPVGTGPFKFVEREIDVQVVLERNDDYWGEKPKLEKLIFRQITDPATRVGALRAGEVNMVTEPTWDEIESLVQEGFQLVLQPNVPSLWYAQFNMKSPAVKDVRVRRAINMAIDREGLARDVLKGTGHAEHGMLSGGTYAYDPSFKPYPYDPEGAKKLLAEAGFANGLDITFEIFDYGWDEAWERWVQRDLKKVGINVQLQRLEWMTYLGKWLQGMPPEIAMNSMGWGWSTPYWTAHATRCDHQPPNGVNGGWYCNQTVDALYTQALKSKDQAVAAKAYREANRIIMEEDVGYMPVFSYHNPILLAPNVKGFVNGQENWYDFTLPSVE